MTALAPHPDRLFPADPVERDLARRLHASVADAPIYSPHGHVDAGDARSTTSRSPTRPPCSSRPTTT